MGNIFQKLLTKLGLLKKNKNNKKDSNYQETFASNNNNYSNYSNNQSNEKISNTNSMQTQQLELKNLNIKTVDNEKEINHTKIYDVSKISSKKINTIWDVIKARENTQAEHIIACLPDDEWIDMEDLKNRIKLQYNVEYQNEKSLYPYIKTLTDINLIKVNNSGKKRTWKKNIIIIEKE
ncbi:MAG TPA: hypothetical protein PLK55_01875 [archaeon]|jgi:hypothetical protein|nr:hypothetical protein [archaeon]